jgi:hypothetical protein
MTSKKLHLILLIIPFICFVYTVVFWAGHLQPLDVIWVDMQNYNERGEHAAMAAAYERLVEKYPEDPELLYALGWAWYKTGRYVEAGAAVDAAGVINEYIGRNPFYPPWRQHYVDMIRQAAFDSLRKQGPQ